MTYWLGRRFFEYVRLFGWIGPSLIALAVIAIIVIAVKLWRPRNPAAEKPESDT